MPILLIVAAAAVVVLLMPKKASAPAIVGEDAWLPLVRRIAQEVGVSEALLAATVKRESNWNPGAVNDTGGDARRGGAYGLAQMTLRTAQGLGYKGEGPGLLDPEVNVRLAARLHKANSRLLSARGDLAQLEDTISRYNSGKPFANAPTFTKDVYVPGVLAALKDYQKKGLA
jgi:soluble lytic murein transglycosylase-like protein